MSVNRAVAASPAPPVHLTAEVPTDVESLAFVESLAADLRTAGAAAQVVRGRHGATLEVEVQGSLNDAHVRRLQRERAVELLDRVENAPVLRRLIRRPDRISPHSINPAVRVCSTPDEYALFEYCRLSQRIPSGRRIGRQIRLLVFDEGQNGGLNLIGAVGLASSTYALACRDRYLDWSGAASRSRKEEGLKRLMDLSLCVALEPYPNYLCGKMLAALALSDPVRIEFRRKYEDELLAVTTSCASGIHCPMFNRIGLRVGGLYKRIGMTSGYSLAWLTPQTLRAARQLVGTENGHSPHEILAFRSKPLVTMREALKRIGVPFEGVLHLGTPKAIYLGSLSERAIECLRSGRRGRRLGDKLAVDTIVQYWRDVLLPRRLRRETAPAHDAMANFE